MVGFFIVPIFSLWWGNEIWVGVWLKDIGNESWLTHVGMAYDKIRVIILGNMSYIPIRTIVHIMIIFFVKPFNPVICTFLNLDLVRDQPLFLSFQIEAITLILQDDLELIRKTIYLILAYHWHLLVSLWILSGVVLDRIAIELCKFEKGALVHYHALFLLAPGVWVYNVNENLRLDSTL